MSQINHAFKQYFQAVKEESSKCHYLSNLLLDTILKDNQINGKESQVQINIYCINIPEEFMPNEETENGEQAYRLKTHDIEIALSYMATSLSMHEYINLVNKETGDSLFIPALEISYDKLAELTIDMFIEKLEFDFPYESFISNK